MVALSFLAKCRDREGEVPKWAEKVRTTSILPYQGDGRHSSVSLECLWFFGKYVGFCAIKILWFARKKLLFPTKQNGVNTEGVSSLNQALEFWKLVRFSYVLNASRSSRLSLENGHAYVTIWE